MHLFRTKVPIFKHNMLYILTLLFPAPQWKFFYVHHTDTVCIVACTTFIAFSNVPQQRQSFNFVYFCIFPWWSSSFYVSLFSLFFFAKIQSLWQHKIKPLSMWFSKRDEGLWWCKRRAPDDAIIWNLYETHSDIFPLRPPSRYSI